MTKQVRQVVSTVALTSNLLSPIMEGMAASSWLHKYFDLVPPYVVGDDLATCNTSCAAVYTTALLLGTGSPIIIAGMTSYPVAFVAAVIKEMTTKKLWDLGSISELSDTLRNNRDDSEDVCDAVSCAMEDVWNVVWSPDAYVALESLRQRVLFGGAAQRWLDSDAVDYFELD